MIEISSKRDLGYNLELEYALKIVFGDKYYNCAALFNDPKYVKDALKEWIKVMRQRLYNLTNYDERLRLTTSLFLDSLDHELIKLPNNPNVWQIIPILISLINHMAGYDWDGKVNRHVIYFQDAEQEVFDLKKMGKINRDDYEWNIYKLQLYKIEIAKKLKGDGLNTYKISQILNVSESTVRRFLKSNEPLIEFNKLENENIKKEQQ